jgi:CRISPR-associated protein Cmr3
LALIPRDGLFCKDGRGWFTSASGRGHALDWPFPSTLLGALRTACGRAIEAGRGRPLSAEEWLEHGACVALGATLALRRSLGASFSKADRLWPVPADALFLEGQCQVTRLDPKPPLVATLGRNDDDAREGLWRPIVDDPAKPRTPPRWWRDAEFSAWLAGQPVAADPDGEQQRPRMHRRLQAHVGIAAETQTAEEGILFAHDVFETLDGDRSEWGIACAFDRPGDVPPPVSPVTLGSDRRPAHVETLAPEVFAAPQALIDTFKDGRARLRLVAVTPLVFKNGWLPDGLTATNAGYQGRLDAIGAEVMLRAAFVPRPQHVSGWDMARNQNKPVTRLVPSGAVYFFECCGGRAFTAEDATKIWLSAIGDRVSEGYGRVVLGVW